MHLTQCFIEIFAVVTDLANTLEAKQPPFEQIREELDRLFTRSETLATSGNVAHEDFDQARFAVCAWTDEVLGSSRWNYRQLWLNDQLQRRYYRTSEAGEEFFRRLSEVGLHQHDVREVYYLCLALGFTGKYCNPGDEVQLEQLKTSNLKMLLGTSAGLPPLETAKLFPAAYPSAEPPALVAKEKRRAFSLMTAACLVGPLLVFAILFAVYRFTLSAVTENFFRTVGN